MPNVIVVNNPKSWPFQIPGVEVVEARAYLTQSDFGERKGIKLFNLCRSYKYQSTGYYVTLLAAARGHRPIPSITTFQDLRSPSMARIVSEELDELIQKSLARLESKEFVLSVYFGRNLAKRYDRLSRELFNLLQAPLLRARFVKLDKWHLRHLAPVSMGDVPKSHSEFILGVATEYFQGRRPRPRKRRTAKYDLAILVNPKEELPPSDGRAIRKFVDAAAEVGMDAEVIGPDDYSHIAEFDALFIRETTYVNHQTYRFARRAAFEGLVVIDDPESIVKCTNKVFLAELLKRHGVPTPKTLVVHKDNVEALRGTLGFPVVLKKPDSAFSHGVIKVDTDQVLNEAVESFFEESDLLVAQEFRPTEFDWRIGVLDGQALYACKYFMADHHWQIYNHGNVESTGGRWETLPVETAPKRVVQIARKAAGLIGKGLYGVDLKQVGKEILVMEVNDNPSVDSGVEDRVIGDELYRRIMQVIFDRIEEQKKDVGK